MVTPSVAARARTSTVPPRRRVAHRVLEQVGDDLVHALGIAVGGEVGGVDRHRHRDLGRVQLLLAHRVRRAAARPGTRVRSSGTAPDSSRERSRSCFTRRPSRSTWASMVRNVSGSGSATPSTRFSSSACSAVIGVRSSCDTLATRSRRTPVGLGELGRHLVERAGELADLVARRRRTRAVVVALGHLRRRPRPSRAAATSCPARGTTPSPSRRPRR